MFAWEIVFGLGALALAAALIWGMARNRRRNRANDPLTEEATARQYDDPAAREAISRDARRKVRPG